MKNKSLMTKVMTGILTAGVVLSSAGLAFAKGNTSNVQGNLNKFSLTQKVGDNNVDPSTAIKTALDKLVTAGTITQDQETKIIDYINQKDTARKAEMDKVKNMTEAERQAYFEQNKTAAKTDLTTELVAASIITQTQADAVKAALPTHEAGDHKVGQGDRGTAMKEVLNKLVTAGTITQDQETKIVDYMNTEETARKAEMDKVKDMTETERQAYFEQNKTTKTDLLASLVSSSIITQAQADAIKAAMPTPSQDGNKGPHGPAPESTSSTTTTNQ